MTDLFPTDDAHDGGSGSLPLSRSLAQLAATVPDNPARIEQVRGRVRRQRRRRRSAGVAVAAVGVSASLGGLVHLRSAGIGTPRAAVGSASTTSSSSAATDCAAVAGTSPAVADPAGAATAKANADGTTVSPPVGSATKTGSTVDRRGEPAVAVTKGFGTVTAADDAELTVTLDAPGPGVNPSITASFDRATRFFDGDAEVTTRPAVAVGDHVLVGAEARDGGANRLTLLVVHAAEESAHRAGKVADAARTPVLKIEGDVIGVEGTSITIRVVDGALPAGRVVTAEAATATEWYAGSQPCSGGPLAAGDRIVAVLGPPLVSGSYVMQSVNVAPIGSVPSAAVG